MKYFRKVSNGARITAAALIGAGSLSLAGWEARAVLPRWMQDAVSGSAIEAALYRAMQLPQRNMLYPRPPAEAKVELTALMAKAPQDEQLYSLRAMEEEQALDFGAAESDWESYAAHAKDKAEAQLTLADYYHRRMKAADEVRVLMAVGGAPEAADEQYTSADSQRSWRAFERVVTLAEDQALSDDVTGAAYAAWIKRYPQQEAVYARALRWRLTRKDYDAALQLIAEFKKAFPQDAVFPLKASALIEYRRGSVDAALTTYDTGFEPLWPAELVQSYYALLAQTHNQRRLVADARARLAANPDDLNAMARLFYYAQQQGNLPEAQQTIEAYRANKEARNAAWSVQELFTLAQLTTAIRAYPEAARYDYALYHAHGEVADGATEHESAQEAGLSGIVRILLTAPEQPVALAAGNLSMYRDMATLDRGPGYWNGILSLWLNSSSPAREYAEEEQRVLPYFHRAMAARLLARLDKEFPNATERAELHGQLIGALAGYGESAQVVKAGSDFLSSFNGPQHESNRLLVAMQMADAYARLKDTQSEFALYDRMLVELGAGAAGMPLTAATASNRGATRSPVGRDTSAEASRNGPAKSLTFEIGDVAPNGVSVVGAREYQQILERYLGRLTATGKLPEALSVLRRELDHNPNDPQLYERLATFLQQNNMSAQQEQVYAQAIDKFGGAGWYDKLARLYLREKKREAFTDLTRKVTGIFSGTDLETYFQQVHGGGPQMVLQLNLYAHQRFPHDLVFIRNLLQAYRTKQTYDDTAWEALLREHWCDSDDLRAEFFDFLSSHGKLDAELKRLRELAPDESAQKANPAAARELADAEMWRSHFEASAPVLGELVKAYPADETVGTEASSVFRSLAYFDGAQTKQAVTIEENLLAANPSNMDRLARIGDIYSDSGADGVSAHEDLAAAAPYFRKMAALHPGKPDGYLQAATVFWDYFQFDDALGEIRQARTKFGQPRLYGYEAGAIDEGKREMAAAISEYVAAASAEGEPNEPAATRLMQLARRRQTAKTVDDETAHAAGEGGTAALELRVRILKVQKRTSEIAPLLETALGRTKTSDEALAIGAEAQANDLPHVYELSLRREMALATDPVQKIELAYDLMRSLESRKATTEAEQVVAETYRDNPRLLGVVRATTDFYWRNGQKEKAIATLLEASKAAETAQPALGRQFVVEAADKANDAGRHEQARSLMNGLLVGDPYNAQYLAVDAESYAGDDSGLKQFYQQKLDALKGTTLSADEKKQKTVLLRRGMIPALTRMKDYAGAVQQYIAIVSAYPEDTATVHEAAQYALKWKLKQQLVEFAAKTVKDSPRDSRFAIVLAQWQTTFADYPAAIDAYAHAVAIRSDRSDLYQAKAELEERLQRFDDACKDYERLYVLSYRAPDWMVKIAEARARQGRREDVVKALEQAWIVGHSPLAPDYFRVARQLESWGLLEDALRFAEQGVKAEGDNLLAGADPGNANSDDPLGAPVYVRLMTRLRKPEAALAALTSARAAAVVSPNAPAMIVQQIEKQGVAAVTDSDWRQHRAEQRAQTATVRFKQALTEIAKTAGTYFVPEEKTRFAALLDAGFQKEKVTDLGPTASDPRLVWLDAAHDAAVLDDEAKLRRQVLLEQSKFSAGQLGPYVELERSRMEYAELAGTVEEYALQLPAKDRSSVRTSEVRAWRDAGDGAAELHALELIGKDDRATGLRERYLQLVLKLHPDVFAQADYFAVDDTTTLMAANMAVKQGALPISLAALDAHSQKYGAQWQKSYAALLGLYFRDTGERTEASFHAVLGDQRTIGQRVDAGSRQTSDGLLLTGHEWFYYGMRYGVERTLAPEKEWSVQKPDDYLPAGLEGNSSAVNFIALAQAYADANETNAALTEYRHALELVPDAPAVHDAMALLEWRAKDKDAAISDWRAGLTALNRIQDKGPAPESFWTSFRNIAVHAGSRKLTTQLRSDVDGVLRNYLARNGNYRSDELLHAVFDAAENKEEAVTWMLELSGAAHDPSSVLSQIDAAEWLPREAREQILLKEISLARAAAGQDDDPNNFQVQTLVGMEKRLVTLYLELKEDAKAREILNALTEDQRRDPTILHAELVLAVRDHSLDALLNRYRADAQRTLGALGNQALRNEAAEFARTGDNASALALWECVFDIGETEQTLMASDYLGLAEARLRTGNVAGAVELLRRMTLLPGSDSVYTNYDLAAALLEKQGHAAEAIEFLTMAAKGVPWNVSYQVRLAKAQLKAKAASTESVAALKAVAAAGTTAYGLRLEAAMLLRNAEAGDLPEFGSDELQRVARGTFTDAQARQPYFVAARMIAAEAASDPKQRGSLLREAVAIAPNGLTSPDAFSEDRLMFEVFRSEEALRHDATAAEAVQRLTSAPPYSASDVADDASDDAEEVARVGQAAPISASVNLCEGASPLPERLARMAPTDAEKVSVALELDSMYQRLDEMGIGLPYLKLAACLEPDAGRRKDLRSTIKDEETELALAAENASRSPDIRPALDQANLVRPRLTTAAELERYSELNARGEVAQ